MHQRLLSALLGLAALSSPLYAGTDGKVITHKDPVEPAPSATTDWLSIRSSYTGSSDFERGDDASGDSFFKSFELNHRIALDLFGGWPRVGDGQWYLRLGADYRRWDFDNDGGLPVPNTLQSFSAIIALEYLIRDAVAITIEARPGFYFEHDVRGDSFNVPVIAYAPLWWHEGDNLSFAVLGGVSYNAMRSHSVLPALGIVAKYGKWTLFAVPPQPRLIYSATDELSLWVEGEITGGAFRTDDADFERQENLNHAVVTYSETRVGGGITWKPCANATLDVGAGWAFNRKFDFHRAEEGFKTDEGAPFVKLEFRASF